MIIAQTFGFTFVGIILICLGWSIVEYLFPPRQYPKKSNEKLIKNMKKFDNK